MKRIKLTVAYDGTNYHGWQVQPNADTIEGELNKAISELTGEQIEVIGEQDGCGSSCTRQCGCI